MNKMKHSWAFRLVLGIVLLGSLLTGCASDQVQQPPAVDPNVDILWKYTNAWQEGDLEAAESLYADDVVVHHIGNHSLAGDYHGKEELTTGYIDRMLEMTKGKATLLEIVEVLAGDEYGMTIVRSRFERSGREPLEVQRSVVYRIRDGHLAELWIFDHPKAASDAFFS